MLDSSAILRDFPLLLRPQADGRPLCYLDSGATTQKPASVIEAIREYYEQYNANVHRGIYGISERATEACEVTRSKIRTFINASSSGEIIYTRNATEAINLVARAWGEANLKPGDTVILSEMEHHSNLVPWQQMVQRNGGELLVVPMDDNGVLDLQAYEDLLKQGPQIVAMAHVSNTLGTVNPVKEMIRLAHQYGALAVVDGAQSMAHLPIDVQDLDCDFFVFSGHKMYAPMGIGGLYGKTEWLEKMPPYQFGGEMVDTVSFEKTTFNKLPFKFEAGTPNVGAALGLETAIQFMESFDRQEVAKHEDALVAAAIEGLSKIEGMRFIGQAPERSGLVSFIIDGIHPYDLGTIIDKMGVAVRTGHHCAEPVMTRFGIPGTVRASFAMYNTLEEVDVLVKSVARAANMLR